jgi:hypothetical protein
MRDLCFVLGSSTFMAVLMLVLIPASIHHSMPKNAPASVLFATAQLVKVSYRDTDAPMIVH